MPVLAPQPRSITTLSPVLVFRARSRSRFAVARPSACLSSVTLVHPTQAVVIFGNLFKAFGTLVIRWQAQKILWRSSQGNPSVGGVKPKRVSKI